jgi:hypothetical protein
VTVTSRWQWWPNGLAAKAAGEEWTEGDPEPDDWSQVMAAVRGTELAMLLASVPEEQQQAVADAINRLLGHTSVRFRLMALT